MYPKISKNLISLNNIKLARAIVLKELDALRADYFPEEDYHDFIINHIYIASPMLLLLQSRCFFNGLADVLVCENLLTFVKEHIENFTAYHAVFLRIHHPDMLSNGKERKDDITSTPLHYDSYGGDTRTTWIPLQDIDESTGSLCYASNKKLIEMTGNGLEPHHLHDSLIDNEAEYINLLKKHISTIKCKEGQVAIFDKNLLHGATYSKSKMRISVDLRWIESVDGKHSGSIADYLEFYKSNSLIALYLNKDFKFIYRETIKMKYIFIHISYQLRRSLIFKRIVKSIKKLIIPRYVG
jgi:hypothetical protein